ncbi:MAG: DUF362 domain-containing protein [Dysgonamonadaceae bacterium]|jgi:uncharacterized Fe-S center protein|nr:DUF362 domain-containing protein [Dysgonamonadaceae bacterium]
MSKVYFTNLRTTAENSLPNKLERLVKRAGIGQIDFKDKFTAIKIHFGEPGNMAFIRHNYAAKMVEILNSLGAKVFFTDANTLYSGRRSNAIDHLIGASDNGFNLFTAKAPVIIADGLKGTEYIEMPVPNGEYCKVAKVGNAAANADILISLNHFKGHEQAGFGGALKNIGMGCASRGGKMDLHSTSQPFIDATHCTACRLCIKYCNQQAIALSPEKVAVIDYAQCIGCGQCVAVCRFDAAQISWNSSSETMNKKVAEYTMAIVADKPHFHVNFIMNVSPECDCWGSNDMALVPDIGMAASFDPVALDMACAELVAAAPSLAGNIINPDGKHDFVGEDKFAHAHPNAKWRTGLEHAEKIGLGTMKYELINVN